MSGPVEPAVTMPAPHHGGPQVAHRLVMHTTEGGNGFPGSSAAGQAYDTARFFDTTSPYSAHWTVDLTTVEHVVSEGTVAYHAPPNANSIGIEMCAKAAYTYAQWKSPQVWPMVLRAARLAADVCLRHNIPAVKIGPMQLVAGQSGISGHVDVSNAWHETTHTDPGPNFPWAEFIQAVQVAMSPVNGVFVQSMLNIVRKTWKGAIQIRMDGDYTSPQTQAAIVEFQNRWNASALPKTQPKIGKLKVTGYPDASTCAAIGVCVSLVRALLKF